MREALLYLVSSFWLGAVHAATPGHGKTIAAAYIVGARGRPVDALILGIFVTLSHTSGIVLVAILASLGLPGMVPQRVEAYLALLTGFLVIVIGLWMLLVQRDLLLTDGATPTPRYDHDHRHGHNASHEHNPLHRDEYGNDYTNSHDPSPTHHHDHEHGHDHEHEIAHPIVELSHHHEHGDEPDYYSHGWGIHHTHRVDLLTQNRPKLMILLGLGIAGGLLPDPAALAILLSALASGKVMLGLGTVLVFSLGFASTLVVVGIVAAKVGQAVLTWLSGPWVMRIQVGTALLIVAVGVVLTAIAWHTVTTRP